MNLPVEEQEIEKAPGIGTFVQVGALVVAILVLFVVYAVFVGRERDLNDIGDASALINTLFSGLAFAGVIWALVMQRAELRLQRRELELQRRELSMTRREIAGQRGEMELQNRTLRRQAFENSFFQLLRFQRETIEDLSFHQAGGPTSHGPKAIGVAAGIVSADAEKIPKDLSDDDVAGMLAEIHAKAAMRRNVYMGQYFRTLYHVIEFVHESPLEEKLYYANLIRAQLSNAEQLLLFTHGIYDRGRNKWPLFIREYRLLFGLELPPSMLPFRKLYSPEAYGLPSNVEWANSVSPAS